MSNTSCQKCGSELYFSAGAFKMFCENADCNYKREPTKVEVVNNVKQKSAEVPDDLNDDFDFAPCYNCDGHQACEDFGCAHALGLGRMVNNNTVPGNDLGLIFKNYKH